VNRTSQPLRIGVRAHDFGVLPAGEHAAKIAACMVRRTPCSVAHEGKSDE